MKAVELTLQMVRFVQAPVGSPQSPAYWMIVPGMRRLSYEAACVRLEQMPKPVVIAPLQEFGTMGVWPYSSVEENDRARVDHHLANQREYLEESLAHYPCDEESLALFENPADAFTLTVAELRVWASQFAVHCGWTLGDGPDQHTPVRFLVRRPNGDWSPGMVCKPRV